MFPLLPLVLLCSAAGVVAVAFSFLFSSSPHPFTSAQQQLNAALALSLINSTTPSPSSLALIRRPPSPFLPSSDGPSPASTWVSSHIVFFLHVPKTAGQSFTALLLFAYRPYQVLTGREGPKEGHPRMDLTFMKRSVLLGVVAPSARAQFTEQFENETVQVGHADVLIERAFRAGGRATEFITLLRDPIDRVLSHYCYITRNVNAGEALSKSVRSLREQSGIFPTWLSFVEEEMLEKDGNAMRSLVPFQRFVEGQVVDGWDNWHTRAYAGCLHTAVVDEGDQPSFCSSPSLMLEEAKRRLLGFLYFGLTEFFAESKQLLLYTFQYNSSQFAYHLGKNSPPVNRNSGKKSCLQGIVGEGEGEEEVRRWIAGVEHLDVELYRWASEVFWQRVNSLPPGPHMVSSMPLSEVVNPQEDSVKKSKGPSPLQRRGAHHPKRGLPKSGGLPG